MKYATSYIFAVASTFLVALSPLDASININVDAVQKSVVYLYAADASGVVDKTRPLGTAFLVGIPLKSDPTRGYTVLVTARHMLDPVWAKCGGDNPNVIYARMNKKSDKSDLSGSGVEFIPIQLINDGKPTWVHHTDDEVDAAVVPFTVNDQLVDAVSIPIELFPTDPELARQSIGDPVMSAGLLPGLPGNARNYPIFKFGQISNIPSEGVATSCGPQHPSFLVKVWLIAANLVPGNSGSPIFHVPLGGSGVIIGGTRPMLLGVQSMSFTGADVAGMTPIKFVYEILQSEEFRDADLHRGPQSPQLDALPK
jgi:hypothetical protein